MSTVWDPGGDPDEAECRDSLSVLCRFLCLPCGLVDRSGRYYVLSHDSKGLMFAVLYHTIRNRIRRRALALECREQACCGA
jgi:hypothetical protein